MSLREQLSTNTNNTPATAPAVATTMPEKTFNSNSSFEDNNHHHHPNKDIDLHDFLGFLNLSGHVNEMISTTEEYDLMNSPNVVKSSSSNSNNNNNNNNDNKRPKSEVNFKKLAENHLFSELYGSVKHSVSPRTVSNEKLLFGASGGGNNTSWSVSKKKESQAISKVNGLHPKLAEKLDFVINEGILDSVLPFVCPVPVPSSPFVNRSVKSNEKFIKKDVTTNSTVDIQLNSNMNPSGSSNQGHLVVDGVNASQDKDQNANSAGLANTVESTTSVVKLKEQGSKQSFNRTSRTSLGGRQSTTSSTAVDEKREPEVIIHVCDEVKNTSRDFTCPQSLLISKMGYFANVTAGQKLDDMDISVHCDIQIFDWLMRWIKHSASIDNQHSTSVPMSSMSLETGPQLDATNVVPILISASFLQMEPLFTDCLSYCHANLSEVVRAPTNLSCLNDSIITRLAAMFTNSELEMIRDKKERVLPRLWTKLIQSLCEPEPEALRGHFYSLIGLFRCSKCEKCLTNTMKSYISCVPSNIRLNRWGQLVSHHVRDSNWDINSYITQLLKEQKSWRKVYWKLWGHCHFLYCCACETHFPVYQMTWCRYHPETPNFLGPVTEGCISGPTGRYPCCGQQAFRFETSPGPTGCQFREHSVLVETDRERAILNIVQLVSEDYALCEPPPAKYQEAIFNNGDSAGPHWSGVSLMPQRCRQGLLPALNPEESVSKIARRVRRGYVSSYFEESSSDSDGSDSSYVKIRSHSRNINTIQRTSFSTSSEGCESDFSGPKIIQTKKGRKRRTDIPGRFWSGEVSARSNQDHQREFEEKVIKQVIAIVNKKTGSEHTAVQNTGFTGGTYVRLEAEWREQLKQRNNANQSNNVGSSYQAHGTTSIRQKKPTATNN